jgi:hypothetical protein
LSTPLPVLIIAKDYSKEVINIIGFNNMDRTETKYVLKTLRNDEYNHATRIIAQYGAEATKFYDRHVRIWYDSSRNKATRLWVLYQTQKKRHEPYLDLLERASLQEKSGHYKDLLHKRVSRMHTGYVLC